MTIDVNIVFEDLSEETRAKIKKLEDAGLEVTLKYPNGTQAELGGESRWDKMPWCGPKYGVVPCAGNSNAQEVVMEEKPEARVKEQFYCKDPEGNETKAHIER